MRMKKYLFFFAAAGLLLAAGCASERLPSEDIEVPVV